MLRSTRRPFASNFSLGLLSFVIGLTTLLPNSLAQQQERAGHLQSSEALTWTEGELEQLRQLGPWPPTISQETEDRRRSLNPLSGNSKAIALGEKLFFDKSLSANGKVACASCHDPGKAWGDGLASAQAGIAPLHRNTQPLFDVVDQRWFGWDGGSDSLWAASIRPLLAAEEMASNVNLAFAALKQHQAKAVPGEVSQSTAVLMVGQSLAAWMETIQSERSAFDRFRDALLESEKNKPTMQVERSGFTAAAQRGLKIALNNGQCFVCHGGPRFSFGEFHDVGISFMVPGGVDPGRYRGIQRVRQDPYNLYGQFSNSPNGQAAQLSKQVLLQHRNWGEWKIPSLRNLKHTAPYMHNGSLKTLREVVLHYSELNEERLHADGEALLKPLRLKPQEIDDLVAFLESLSSEN